MNILFYVWPAGLKYGELGNSMRFIFISGLIDHGFLAIATDWNMYPLKNASHFISGRRRHRESQRAGRAAKHSQAIQGKVKREIAPPTGWQNRLGAHLTWNAVILWCPLTFYKSIVAPSSECRDAWEPRRLVLNYFALRRQLSRREKKSCK